MIVFDQENFPPRNAEHVKFSAGVLRDFASVEGAKPASLRKRGSDIGRILFANVGELGLTCVIGHGLTQWLEHEENDPERLGYADIFTAADGGEERKKALLHGIIEGAAYEYEETQYVRSAA